MAGVPTVAVGDRRARGAVSALFVVNGATYNSLVPWFPALRDGLGLSNAQLGAAIAACPAPDEGRHRSGGRAGRPSPEPSARGRARSATLVG